MVTLQDVNHEESAITRIFEARCELIFTAAYKNSLSWLGFKAAILVLNSYVKCDQSAILKRIRI